MAQKIALLVGNDDYEDTKLRDLAVPLPDVRALQTVLERTDISAFDRVDTMINPPLSDVQRAVAALFAKRNRDDLVLLYFSGHGVRDAAGHLYLALRETEFDLLPGTSVSSTFLKEVMDKSRSRRQILILDCCHSGAFGRGAKSATGAVAVTEATFEVQGYGRAVLTSSGETQLSFEGDQIIGDTNRSLFTHYLVEGLESGKAAPEGEETITVEQLYQYTHDHVVTQNPNQKPAFWIDRGQGALVFARNSNPVIKAKELSASLLDDLNSENTRTRSGAVIELARLLSGNDHGFRLAAENALRERIEIERDRYIFDEIENALNTAEMSATETEPIGPEEFSGVPQTSPTIAAKKLDSTLDELDVRETRKPRRRPANKPTPSKVTEAPSEAALTELNHGAIPRAPYVRWWLAPSDFVTFLAKRPQSTFRWVSAMLIGFSPFIVLGYSWSVPNFTWDIMYIFLSDAEASWTYIAICVFHLMIAGFGLGVAQCFIYRRTLYLGWRWMMVSTLCWALGGLIGGYVAIRIIGIDWPGPLFNSDIVYAPSIIGIVAAMLSAVAQRRLLRLRLVVTKLWYWSHIWPWLLTWAVTFFLNALISTGLMGLRIDSFDLIVFGFVFGGFIWILSIGAFVQIAIERKFFRM